MKTPYPKSRSRPLAMVVALGVGFAAMPAGAQYYGGLLLGPLTISGILPAPPDFPNAAADAAWPTSAVAPQHGRTIYGLKLGYPLASNLAIEGSYSELTRASYAALTPPAGLLKNPDARGYGLDLVGALPLSARLSLFGRAGVQGIKADSSPNGIANIDLAAATLAQLSAAAHFGVGVRYDISNSLGLRLEVERFRRLAGSSLGEFGADSYSFGVQFKF